METNDKTHQISIFNDDVNSIDYVMACLIKFCNHEIEQAAQCTFIAHHKGKCSVKIGDFLEMIEIKTNLDRVDIKSEIEEYASNMY